MVSTLDFQSGGQWFKPGLYRHVVSLGKKLYFTFPLFTQVYKWVLAIIMQGVTLQWTNVLSGGSSNIPSRFMLQKPELSAGLMSLLARMQTQPCQNVPAASNVTAFSQFFAAYSTLDFTRSPLAGKGTWCLLPTTPSMLPILLQKILTGLQT